jgi:hypothetical protein
MEQHNRGALNNFLTRSLQTNFSCQSKLKGARKKKLQQNQIRKDKEEEDKRQVDLEHAQMMAEERRKNLEQARLVQYYETDKVKKFHVSRPELESKSRFQV